MPSIASSPPFDTRFDAQPGIPVEIAPKILRVTAPNASPYTFTGTNSYIAGGGEVVVIDPGPDDDGHLGVLTKAIGDRPVKAILLTHTHKDHCSLASRLAQAVGAPLWFGGKHHLSRPKRLLEVNKLQNACDWEITPDRVLKDGDILEVGELNLQVVATPGHCANHLCFGMVGEPFIFTGDHVMGWNSTLVATPDGSMGDYFNSLDRLIDAPWTHYFPGHGGAIEDVSEASNGRRFARALRKHRALRNQQIIDAVKSGATNVGRIVDRLYPGVGVKIRIAAQMTVVAHIEYLEQQHQLRVNRSLLGRPILSVLAQINAAT